jgi:hypothetical protein
LQPFFLRYNAAQVNQLLAERTMTDTTTDVAEQPSDPAQGTTTQSTAAPKRKFRQLTAEELSDRKIKKWSELLETIVLTIATLATVWAGYQAGQWSGTQASANVEAIALRIESAELAGSAQQQQLADVAIFTNWVNATAAKDQPRADFYAARFRAEFKPAFAAWLATQPLTNPDAPASPFEMSEYRLALQDTARQKTVESGQRSEEGERAGSIGDKFTLTAVILAGSLLLAGLASRFQWEELRVVVVAVALLVLLFSIIRLLMLPMA